MFATTQDQLLLQFWGVPGLASVQETCVLMQIVEKILNISNYSTFNNRTAIIQLKIKN
jgi:hypothetical protein